MLYVLVRDTTLVGIFSDTAAVCRFLLQKEEFRETAEARNILWFENACYQRDYFLYSVSENEELDWMIHKGDPYGGASRLDWAYLFAKVTPNPFENNC